MTEEEKINAGILFRPGEQSLRDMKLIAHNLSMDYNKLYENETEKREEIIAKLLGEFGEGSFMQGPITFHYGTHTKIGKKCFINFNFSVHDDAEVTIGDNCNFGANVTIVTAVHPMLPDERKLMHDSDGNDARFVYGRPVNIGHDCWFGANVVVCSGVTIGENCVIGAGSVVVKNIPANTFAAGNPCRVIRELSEADSMIHKPEILADNSVIK